LTVGTHEGFWLPNTRNGPLIIIVIMVVIKIGNKLQCCSKSKPTSFYFDITYLKRVASRTLSKSWAKVQIPSQNIFPTHPSASASV